MVSVGRTLTANRGQPRSRRLCKGSWSQGLCARRPSRFPPEMSNRRQVCPTKVWRWSLLLLLLFSLRPCAWRRQRQVLQGRWGMRWQGAQECGVRTERQLVQRRPSERLPISLLPPLIPPRPPSPLRAENPQQSCRLQQGRNLAVLLLHRPYQQYPLPVENHKRSSSWKRCPQQQQPQ